MKNIIYTQNFTREATQIIVEKIEKSLSTQDSCVLCLAGGQTPLSIYEELAKSDIDWSRVYFTQGDERNVSKDDPESNFKGAYDSLLSKINSSEDHTVRIKTELGFEQSAEAYEQDLKNLQAKLERDYLFDIVLLGIGHDGHTASLFPNSPALTITDKLVYANTVNHTHRERITLTYPALNSSKEIIILSNDPAKKGVIEQVMSGADFPITKVHQWGDKVTWIL